MRYLLFLFPVLLKAQTIQLAPPQFSDGTVFFQDKTEVALAFDLDGATIHYALGHAPTPESSNYTLPFLITESTEVEAIACHPDFLQSAVVTRQFIGATYRPEQMSLLKAANARYPGKGAATLCDLQKGTADLHDGNWLGFLGDTVIVESFFADNISCKNLIISTLNDSKSWILPCKAVSVFGKKKHGKWQKIGTWRVENDAALLSETALISDFITLPLKPFKTSHLKIEIIPFGNLPAGHPGAGTPAWLFLDEIIFQ